MPRRHDDDYEDDVREDDEDEDEQDEDEDLEEVSELYGYDDPDEFLADYPGFFEMMDEDYLDYLDGIEGFDDDDFYHG